jgi:hypothetical protein
MIIPTTSDRTKAIVAFPFMVLEVSIIINKLTDFLYLRFIGDRTIDEKDFGKIQKDRVMEMKKWASKVKSYQRRRERKKRYQSCNIVC